MLNHHRADTCPLPSTVDLLPLGLFIAFLVAPFCTQPSGAMPDPRWESRGPFCSSPLSYAGDPTAGDLVFLTLPRRGLFRSGDDGLTWQNIDSGLPPVSTGLVAYDAAHPEYLYYAIQYASEEHVPRETGVFRSRDGGDTWQLVRETTDQLFSRVRTMAVPSGSPGTVLISDELSLKRSLDGGESFHTVWNGGIIREQVVHPREPQKLWFNDGGHVGRSDNLGDSWTTVQLGTSGYLWRLTVAPDLPETAYISSLNELHRVDGDASTWIGALPGLSSHTSPRALLAAPQDTLFMSTGSIESAEHSSLWRSTDGGQTWSGTSLRGENVFDLQWLDAAQRVVVLAHAGVFYSDDLGDTWQSMEQGIHASNITALALVGENQATVLAAASCSDCTHLHIARSVDGGRHWQRGKALEPHSVHDFAVDPNDPQRILAATGSHLVLRSPDGGESWQSSPFEISPEGISDGITIHPTDSQIVFSATRGGGVAKSVDGGLTWERLSLPEIFDTSYDVAIDPTLPDRMYVALAEGRVGRSLDGGETWEVLELGNGGGEALRLYLQPGQPETLFVVTLGPSVFSLYRSRDGGDSWEGLENGLDINHGIYLAFDPHDPNTILLTSGNRGMFRSFDGGDTWAPYEVGLPFDAEAVPVVMHPSGNIFIGTRQYGVFNVAPCQRGGNQACLLDGRFRVRGTMKDFGAPPQTRNVRVMNFAEGRAESDQMALFESFSVGSLELAIKMVDACHLEEGDPRRAFWAFFGGLTNAAAEVLVEDTAPPSRIPPRSPVPQTTRNAPPHPTTPPPPASHPAVS